MGEWGSVISRSTSSPSARQPVLITGTGAGKSFLACALAQMACREPSRSLFGQWREDLESSADQKKGALGQPIELSPREFQLLNFFIRHRGEIVTLEKLLDEVSDYNAIPFTRTVDMHIAKLRKKIEDDCSDPKLHRTVHRWRYNTSKSRPCS